MSDMDRDAVMDLHARLQAQWNGRNAEYDLARRRYHGVHWDAETNPAPENRYWITLNYLKPFVDKSVQLLVGRMPALQVMPPGVDEPARRLAEQEEGILYGTWEANNAPDVFQKTAWDSFVLRRGIVYVYWDPKKEKVCFRNVAPEHFFPEYDGDRIYRAMYVQRRSTDALKKMYPEHADEITDDAAMNYPYIEGSDLDRRGAAGQTTVFDLYEADGTFYRVMANAFIGPLNLELPFEKIPFVEFPCYPVSGETEPLNLIDQLVEINQYIDQLFSQHADIISRYANPVVLDKASGQTPEAIRRSMGAPGAIIPVRRDGDIELLGWQGNVPAIQEQMTFAMDALFDLAGKPRSAFGQTVTNQSGVMTNLTLTPTLQSNEQHETIWGHALAELNEWVLALWEKNMPGDQIKMRGRYTKNTGATKYYEVQMTGAEIGGWYKNRIKWPSAIRTDDPVYIQNNLQQLTSDPPAISLYTYLERLGVEDVEAEIDRIQQQLEDPRLHPDRLESMANVASTIEQNALPGDMAGLSPDGGFGGNAFTDALEGQGNPNKDPLAQAAKTEY